MKKLTLTPVTLRITLVTALLLLAAAGGGVFAYGYGQLKDRAAAAQETATKAEASRSSLQRLVATQKFLTENATTVERAQQLASESKEYLYQDQIISDINAYAAAAGIQILNITFEAPISTAVSAPAATGTAPANGGATTGAPGGTAAAPTSVKSVSAAVTIKNPTSYSSMLTFIHLIEQSLFRMQISSIGLSQSETQGDGGNITSETLTIEAYTR